MIINGVRKIAVLRANDLGDFIVALPALHALKDAFPQAEVALLGKPWQQELLEARPSPIDRVIPVPISQGVREEPQQHEEPAAVAAFFQKMQAEHFDVAIQLHGGGRYSNPFVAHLGARLTIGLQADGAAALDLTVPYVYYQHEIFRYAEVMSLLGVATREWEPVMAYIESDLEQIGEYFSIFHEPYGVVHPGASDARRRWPPEKFAEVVDVLDAWGLRVVMTGTGSEKCVVNEVIKKANSEPTDLCGRLPLKALVGLLSQAAILVSNDTGPAHLARALGTPTVTLYWGPNLVSWGPLTTYRNRVAVSWQINCPVCHKLLVRNFPFDPRQEFCEHQESLVASIQTREVVQLARELIRV